MQKTLAKYTLSDLVKRYRDTVTVQKKGCVDEEFVLNAFLRHEICSRRLSELRTEHFAVYRDQRLKEIKPVSLKRQMTPVRHMFEVARIEWGIPIQTNPLAELRLPATGDRRERRVKEGEEEMILASAGQCRNPYIRPIIQIALATAMRRSEILRMECGHIDWQRKGLSIPNSKNGYSRTIPLGPTTYALMQSFGGEGGKVFPITINAFRLSWQRVLKRARIDDLHFHDLRHEAISRLFEMGLTAPEVASISGHRGLGMLSRYAHANSDVLLKKLS